NHYISGAPRAFNGKVIIGNGGADYGHVRGFVTTYDAETGKQLWRFYTVPGDPAKGFENDAMAMAAKTWTGHWWEWGGGGTVWNAITYDPEFDRIYIGTGNGAPWNRKIRSPGGGDNLFLCAVVALDANSGKYVWHYQTTPGESWDYNSAMDMELATLSIAGAERKVLLHAPKNGFFYVLDRRDGKLISAQPFAKVTWAKGIDPATGRPIEDPAARYPNGEAFIWPGPLGAHNWQAMAYSPKTQLAYIPIFNVPGYYDDRGINPKTWQHPVGMVSNGGLNTVIPDMPPADGTPLGALQAWDPARQREVWSVPQLGAMNGGVLSTNGDLVFQGQADGRFLARAADSGRELWSFDAQNGIVAQPITYLANGKQYVSVITGYSGTASAFGPSSAQFGWEYRRQQRRVLTFVLDGKASLPAAPKIQAANPPDDASFVVNAALAESGAKHFANRCAVCHGLAAIAGGAAPDLRYSAIPLSAPAFRSIVHDGALVPRGMPKFDILSEGDLEAIRHYLRRQARAVQSTTNTR
ncbi:MAG: PQQ-binding-like beta-propeller repeat protein, partial [Steroidobacteraceae bacterium]